MNNKLLLVVTLTIVSASLSNFSPAVRVVMANGTIYVRADGSIDPPTAPISTADNITYVFIGDFSDSIVIERDNILVDGAGFKVQGNGTGKGISLTQRTNVTIKNATIKDFTYGIWLNQSANNRILETCK